MRPRQGWYVNGGKRDDLKQCRDIDLSVTPLTNTLPIKRAKLKVGESLELTAAWIKFPSLEVRPLSQTYERLSKRVYRYRSNSGFTARLEVDSFGLVTRYGNIWKQIV